MVGDERLQDRLDLSHTVDEVVNLLQEHADLEAQDLALSRGHGQRRSGSGLLDAILGRGAQTVALGEGVDGVAVGGA